MLISKCIALITFGTSVVVFAIPLSPDQLPNVTEVARNVQAARPQWTDLVVPSDNETKGNYYLEYEYSDEPERNDTDNSDFVFAENESSPEKEYSSNDNNTDLIVEKGSRRQPLDIYSSGDDENGNTDLPLKDKQQLLKDTVKNDEIPTSNHLSSSDLIAENKLQGEKSDTKHTLDIMSKSSVQQQQPQEDSGTIDERVLGTRNEFAQNNPTGNTITDRPVDIDQTEQNHSETPSESGATHRTLTKIETDKELVPNKMEKPEGKKTDINPSPALWAALDEAILDPYISAIDSELENSDDTEEDNIPHTTVLPLPTDKTPDYREMIAEQIKLAEEQIMKKYMDQQEAKDLVVNSVESHSFEPKENKIEKVKPSTLYVYKGIVNSVATEQESFEATSTAMFIMPTISVEPPSSLSEEASATFLQESMHKLVQKTSDGDSDSDSVEEEDTLADDGTFNSGHRLKLPNGNWAPSCKSVTKGLYCLKPDGQGSTIVECFGENVGFEFSCGKDMLCHSMGPFDVDCRKAQ